MLNCWTVTKEHMVANVATGFCKTQKWICSSIRRMEANAFLSTKGTDSGLQCTTLETNVSKYILSLKAYCMTHQKSLVSIKTT